MLETTFRMHVCPLLRLLLSLGGLWTACMCMAVASPELSVQQSQPISTGYGRRHLGDAELQVEEVQAARARLQVKVPRPTTSLLLVY